MKSFFWTAAIIAAPFCAGHALAADVDFSANLTNACSLTVPTPGTLALSANGQVLGSEEVGGLPSTLSVLSIGSSTLSVGAPSVVAAPAGYDNTNETVEVRYLGASGLSAVSQAYTSTATTVPISTIPLSVLTLNAKVTNTDSFTDGDYTVRTVVTCS